MDKESIFPKEFIESLRSHYGEDRASIILKGLQQKPKISVRLNPSKITISELREHFAENAGDTVEWCPDAIYLNERPNFTLDPLFHTGSYYVQEASSMYVGKLFDDIPKQEPLRILDLCAAPGGKTTHILSKINGNDILVANEVIKNRATILAENCAKWGNPNVIVTNNDPSDFSTIQQYFDIIIVDAPCSGEGMFRKDDEAVEQWSENNVTLCASRQKRILADIWDSLRSGGYIIYSTCTFNPHENDNNVDWICKELGADLIEKRQFLPGIDLGEGFFCSLLRKNGDSKPFNVPKLKNKITLAPIKSTPFIKEGYSLISKGDLIKAYPIELMQDMLFIEASLRSIHSGIAIGTLKGKDLIPEADLALSTIINLGSFTIAELTKEDSLRFLAKENLIFKDYPNGYLLLTYKGRALGFVKNLGTRSNNLHPAARRIRKLS